MYNSKTTCKDRGSTINYLRNRSNCGKLRLFECPTGSPIEGPCTIFNDTRDVIFNQRVVRSSNTNCKSTRYMVLTPTGFKRLLSRFGDVSQLTSRKNLRSPNIKSKNVRLIGKRRGIGGRKLQCRPEEHPLNRKQGPDSESIRCKRPEDIGSTGGTMCVGKGESTRRGVRYIEPSETSFRVIGVREKDIPTTTGNRVMDPRFSKRDISGRS